MRENQLVILSLFCVFYLFYCNSKICPYARFVSVFARPSSERKYCNSFNKKDLEE